MIEIVATMALWWFAAFSFGFLAGRRFTHGKALAFGWGFYIAGLILYLHQLSVGSLDFRIIPSSGEAAETIGVVIAHVVSSFGGGYYIGRKTE